MPCRVDESDYGSDPKTNKELDRVTAMLCDVLKLIDDCACPTDASDMYPSVKGLEEWWEKHKGLDKQREEKERATALNKLTTREKELLGLSPKKR